MLASAAFTAALGVYLWRQRAVPGALWLAIWSLLAVLVALGATLEMSAVNASTKVFWFTFQAIWVLPCVTAMVCFTLEYANPGHWLTRRTLVLLAIPPLLAAALMLTNEAHHGVWLVFSTQGDVQPVFGFFAWLLAGYGYVLVLLQTALFIWLFVGSPPHRWPAALMLVGRLATAVAFFLEPAQRNPFAPMDATILAMALTSALYALALFRFRLLDLIPVARETVIQQMREGMLILDAHQRIADLNRSAEKILGIPAPRIRGRMASEVLPALTGFSERPSDPAADEFEISLGSDDAIRHYALQFSPLKDRRGLEIGQLFLFHDVTEQRRAQDQILEQQRVMATLEERQRLARELHDSVGQILGYVNMQAQAIRKWVEDGDAATAEAQLDRLAEIARGAHEDIRESIFFLKAISEVGGALFPALQKCLDEFRDRYGISAHMIIEPGLEEAAFAPGTGVQLVRVIQEALTNARRHGRARNVKVVFQRSDGMVQVVVVDDGCGFDPARVGEGDGDHFGLSFMRERMAQIGGSATIQSQSGAGTRVEFGVPVRDGLSQGELPIRPARRDM
jgi:signal transduction histidine kinase